MYSPPRASRRHSVCVKRTGQYCLRVFGKQFEYTMFNVLGPAEDAILCISGLPPSPTYVHGRLFVGTHDINVYVFDLVDDNPMQAKYALRGHANAEYFVTVGEDVSLRVWHTEDPEALQTIPLPAASKWAVTILTNGNIVDGGDLFTFLPRTPTVTPTPTW
ncbi:uncharacterized protein LOC129587263 [Paramacrobiotus metropolitanus]|uniref:uncharacterized protein LOC129587263 n=1 Tax=Paramacrobiotus metropolitanus TaxID=2943436 RepID=UPI0024461B3D|nr:uncharacterized protein LOC129587263 [Paramacrobiotus metropolitanus]